MSMLTIVLDVAVVLGATVLVLVLLGVLARQLLGVRMSTARIVIAGAVGLGAGVGFESRFVWAAEEYTPALIPVLFGVIVLVSVAVLVIAELVVPQGSMPSPSQWVPITRRALERHGRYAELLRIIARHRLLATRFAPAHTLAEQDEQRRQAQALKRALEEAGGAFVKLGQLLSTRPDVLPPIYLDVLGTLQERVPPAPWSDVRATLERELGAPLPSLFASFDETPVAAASIGQVHAAVLPSGERVAVKVRRPGIGPTVERDIDIARRLARSFADSNEWARHLGVERLVASLADSLRDELDYRLEASNMTALAAAQERVSPDARVRIPRVFRKFSGASVLVMEFVDAPTLGDATSVAAIEAPVRQRLARRLLAATLAQIMDVGVFHADLHPGNIVVLPDAQLLLLDFGSIGHLDSVSRSRLADVLLAFSRGDAAAFADALLEFVELGDDVDEAALRRSIAEFVARRLGPGATVDAAVFGDVVSILAEFGLSAPPELTVPFRTIATVEGTLRRLDPGFDLVAEAGASATRRLTDSMRPSSLAQTLGDELLAALPVVKRLPHRVDRISADLADGRLSVNMRVLADPRDRGFVREVMGLAVVTFLAGIFGIMAAMLLTSETGPAITATLTLSQLFGYLFLVLTGLLSLRVFFDVLRRRPRRRGEAPPR